MKKGTLIYKFLITSFLILFFILLSDDFLFSVLGQELNELPITVDYKPADRGKKPGRGQDNNDSSGIRGNTRGDEDSFVLIIPKNDFGQTYNEYPTFWFYFGYESAKFKFKLNNLDPNKVDNSEDIIFEVNGGPGIFCFQLPTTQTPLKVGEKYEWILSSLNYRAKTHSTVKGFIERTFDVHSSELEKNSFSEKIDILKEGKWYDLLNTLTEKIKENPENKELKKLWFNLLKDENVALDKLSDKLQKEEQKNNVFININSASLTNEEK